MMRALRFGAAIYAALFLCPPAPVLAADHAVTRVYLMRGLLELSPFASLVATLRAHGAIVTTWSWLQKGALERDALAHRGDRIVVGGHSMGDQEAFAAGGDLKMRGLSVRVVGLDPLCTTPRATAGLSQINIWGNACLGRPAIVPGARNVYLPGPSHIGYPADPRVIRAFVAAALSN